MATPNIRAYHSRYAPDWGERSRKCRAKTGGMCCCCMREKATETHHTRYSKNGRSIAGKEKPGEDIFGLCKQCHELIAHSPKNWVRDSKNPALFNRNRPEFAAKLRRNYRILARKTALRPSRRSKKNGRNIMNSPERLVEIGLALIVFAIVLYALTL